MNDNDYPAAHSMDTIWFAVDKKGHVAIFTSGEAGAVPLECEAGGCSLPCEYDKLGALATRHDSSLNVNLRTFMKHPLLLKGEVATWEDLPEEIHCVVVRRTSPLPVKLSDAPDSITTPDGTFAEMHYCPKLDILRQYDSGEITHVWAESSLMTVIGVFEYEHGEEWAGGIAGPYKRSSLPPKPLIMSELPTGTDAPPVVLKDSDFTVDRKIQPADIVPCQFWSNEFVSIDEKTIRPTSPDATIDMDPAERARLKKRVLYSAHLSTGKKNDRSH